MTKTEALRAPSARGGASPHAEAAREAKRREALSIGIDEKYVSTLVESFYGRVRDDADLGPIFDARIGDWPVHLEQMKRFWRSVLFSSGEFLGSPMAKHIAIAELDRPLFVRWLELFRQTLDELGSEQASEHVHGRARMIANSLLNGVVIHREGRLGLDPDEALA